MDLTIKTKDYLKDLDRNQLEDLAFQWNKEICELQKSVRENQEYIHRKCYSKSDPIVKGRVDNKWYWYDEIWTSIFGPYDTAEEADKACLKYATEELGLKSYKEKV